MSVEERFGHGLHRIGRAAVNEEIVCGARGIETYGHSTVDGQDGQTGYGACLQRLPTPNANADYARRNLPGAQPGPEDPTCQETQQNRIIETGREEGWRRNIEVGAGPACEPQAADADAFHKEPAGMIKKLGSDRQPGCQEEANKVANEDERAKRHGEYIGNGADRSHDMEIVGHQG